MTREEALRWLKDFKNCSWDGMPEEALDVAIQTLEQKPRKGKWISDGHGHIVCTACNNANVTIWKSNFCPNCGADMKENEE